MYDTLKEAIRQSERNAISYSKFIELVLYHPKLGYYMKEKEKIGRAGDFFTNSNVSSIFAKQFARFFIRLVSDGVVPPVICEIGAGTGRFAYDVLTEWRESAPDSFLQLRYIIVETSPYHRRVQTELLSTFSVTQYASLDELPNGFEGIVFANELYDAFPVEVIERRGNELYEVYVGIEDERLTEVLYPLQNVEVAQYLNKHGLQLENGQRFEIPLAMRHFVQKLSKRVHKAICVTVDYGYTHQEWMHPSRREGSLRGYYQHQLVRNPLEHPGEMDITTHVHWSELRLVGEEERMHTVLQMKQRTFLLASGILNSLVNHEDRNPFSFVNKQNRAIRSFILEGGMSDAFEVLIQQKGDISLSVERYLDSTFC